MAPSLTLQKEEHRTALLRKMGFPPKTRSLILLDISDPLIREFLQKAGRELDISFIESNGSSDEKGDYPAFDVFISDEQTGFLDIVALVKAGVTPILPKKNAFGSNFSEFDPMKFTGNAFLFESTESYHILEKLVRYLENVRYPGDRRTLLKNLEKTF
ncbi:hypothetical protein KBB25_00790 [Candidatus Gracilibacteria bacterium]|nr:hypothetical protein [Candidatus Gracilibacteria bacterium]